MKLWSINKILRFFGLVLVVVIDDGDGPTLLRLESARRYDRRIGAVR